MKNIRKILTVLVLSAVLVACIAVSSLAVGTSNVKTGEGMNITDYSNVNFLVHDDFEGGNAGKTGATGPRGTGVHASDEVTIKTETGKGAPYVYDTTKGATSSNSYVYVDYSKRKANTLYIEPLYATIATAKGNPAQTPVNGFVMEFDVGSKSTSENNNVIFDIYVMNSHAGNTDGMIKILKFRSNNGKASVTAFNSDGTENTSKRITAASTGGWIHITVLYVPGQSVLTVYANQAKEDRAGSVSRTFMGQYSNIDKASNNSVVYPMGVRLGQQTATSGDFCFDNMLFYQAKNVCDPEYIAHLTQNDAFIAYVNAITNADISNPLRYDAYEKVKNQYIDFYWSGTSYVGSTASNSSLKAAVDKFVNFEKNDAATLKTNTMNDNLKTLTDYVTALKNSKRGIASIVNRETQLATIDSFMESNNNLINKDSDNYSTTIADLETWRNYLESDIDIRTFLNRMDRFNSAKSVEAYQRHYDEATAVYAAANEAYTANYPNFSVSSEKNSITTAINNYRSAASTLATKIKENNALRFINLVNLFKDKTQTDWEADDGTIRNQWYLARGILLENNYKTTTDFTTAKTSIYDPVNAYFSKKMQQEHVDTLNAKLAMFEDPESNYMDKAGVCKYVDNYLEKNEADIDFSDARITAIKQTNASYKVLLEGLEIDYAAMLVQNTVEFVAQMDNIAKHNNYKDLKPLFDEATDNYYSMNIIGNEGANIDTETVKAAVSAYETLRTRLLNIEVYSTQFVTQMADMPNAKYKDDYYVAFMNCYSCEEYLDTTFTGVADYKDRYDSIKSDYLAKIELANAESKSAIDAVCSVRTFCGIDYLVKHVQSLLK